MIKLHSKKIETAGETIWMDHFGIIHSDVKPVFLELEHAKEAIKTISVLANGKKTPVVINMKNAIGTSNSARNYYSGEQSAAVISAAAMIISSPLSKILGNFYLGLNKPLFPFKLFTNEEKAIIWLDQYIKKSNIA